MTFDSFVRDRSHHLLRIAYLLTRDHGHAEDLLQTALARSYSAWRRIDGDPEPYVRKVLVNAFASWRGRRWHGELPADVLPEVGVTPHSAVDDRDEVWRALGRLPRQQRAVVVLRYFEDLTEVQVADALGISVGTVKGYTSRAIATLRADETLRGIEVPGAPPGTERIAAVQARVRHQRHRRIGTAAIAVIAVIAVVLGWVLGPAIGWHSAPPLTPKAGAYTQGYHVVDSVTAPFRAGSVTRVWTPTSTEGGVYLGCRQPVVTKQGTVEVTVDGRWVGTIGCSPHRFESIDQVSDLRPGVPVRVTITVVAADGGPVPADGTMWLSIGDRVPFDEYRFPRPPKHLAPLEPYDAAVKVWLHPGGDVAWVACGQGQLYDVAADSQTSGFIHVEAAGQPTVTFQWWNWDTSRRTSLVEPKGMGLCRIAVTAEHLTGDWYALLVPAVRG